MYNNRGKEIRDKWCNIRLTEDEEVTAQLLMKKYGYTSKGELFRDSTFSPKKLKRIVDEITPLTPDEMREKFNSEIIRSNRLLDQLKTMYKQLTEAAINGDKELVDTCMVAIKSYQKSYAEQIEKISNLFRVIIAQYNAFSVSEKPDEK